MNFSKFTSDKKISSSITLLLFKKKLLNYFITTRFLSLAPLQESGQVWLPTPVGVRHVDCRGRDIEPYRVNIIMSMLSIGNPYIIYQTYKQK